MGGRGGVWIGDGGGGGLGWCGFWVGVMVLVVVGGMDGGIGFEACVVLVGWLAWVDGGGLEGWGAW